MALSLSVVILAAGNGKRMHSTLPKVLHPLGGIPLLLRVIHTAQSLDPDSIYVVYGNHGKQVRQAFPDINVTWIQQPVPQGTGHALLQVLPHIEEHHRVLVLYGDVPLIKVDTLEELLSACRQDDLGLLVAQFENPTGFGRIVRDQNNEIRAIIEQKDATLEQLKINEINTGILTARAVHLKKWLPRLKNENAQGEYYLTDIVALAVSEHIKVISILASSNKEVSGVNDRKELIALERQYQREKAKELLMQGVTIIDPERFDCRGNLTVGKDVVIDINVIFEGDVTIEEGSIIGAHSVLKNVRIGKEVVIKPHCVIEDAEIADECQIGPFAHIRPNTYLNQGVHVGNFVELKNTTIDEYSKANHLTYLGDSKIGKKVNVGAGTITCNYDGVKKYQTIIADGAFIGSGTELVAPVTIGEGAYIGAGSTITRDAPAEQLTLGRAKQVTIKNWKKNKK